MSDGINSLKFQNTLKQNKEFLKSLTCKSLFKRKVILQKATNKEIKLLQKLLVLFSRGHIGVTQQVISRLQKSKKLSFIEQSFSKIKKDSDLKKKIVKLSPVIHLFAKATLKKNEQI